ncbi:MAG: glycosyltransferase [Archangiaceae bacterium]|nr:glycosyltransferase [Archangiaceae bacterium]
MNWVLVGLLFPLWVGWCSYFIQYASLVYVSRRRFAPPPSYPPVSILKPMAGYDDDLVENLESHLALDYPGGFEILIGVRDTTDPAYRVAKDFAEKHAARGVRLVLQEGEPGLNPKVNQLITLTRHAKHDLICVTDANVRVPTHYLREHAAVLAVPHVGLSTNAFAGVEEESLGAALENMTHASFAAASISTGEALRANQIVGKSLVVSKATLEKVGGWGDVIDLLAEDQRIGRRLAKLHIRTLACPTFVQNVQRKRTVEAFWDRYARWAMIRFLIVPGYWLEPMLTPSVFAAAVVAWHPVPWTWALFAATLLASAIFTDACARVVRGKGIALKYLVLFPLRDLLLIGAWFRGQTLRTIDWRGNVLKVGRDTRLTRVKAAPERLPVTSPAAPPRPPS